MAEIIRLQGTRVCIYKVVFVVHATRGSGKKQAQEQLSSKKTGQGAGLEYVGVETFARTVPWRLKLRFSFDGRNPRSFSFLLEELSGSSSSRLFERCLSDGDVVPSARNLQWEGDALR